MNKNKELVIKNVKGGDDLTIYFDSDENVVFDIFEFTTTVKKEEIKKIINFLKNIEK